MKDELWYPSVFFFFSSKQQVYPFLVASLSKCKLKLSIVGKYLQITHFGRCVMSITGGIERHAEEGNNFDHRASGNLLFWTGHGKNKWDFDWKDSEGV